MKITINTTSKEIIIDEPVQFSELLAFLKTNISDWESYSITPPQVTYQVYPVNPITPVLPYHDYPSYPGTPNAPIWSGGTGVVNVGNSLGNTTTTNAKMPDEEVTYTTNSKEK